MIIERHISSDGLLQLIVDFYQEDKLEDYAIGFEGFAGHTHGDILASLRGLSEKEAIRQYVDEILNDKQIIAVSRINGKIEDIWITDSDIESELKYKPAEEDLEFRFWSGKNAGQK